MAEDIGGYGEDPREVARRRLNIGRRAREEAAARRARQASGPTATPSTQSVVPYEERLPASGGGRGGPPATTGGREMTTPRGENLPAVRREGMPAVRPAPGSSELMRQGMGMGRPGAGAGMRPRLPGPLGAASTAMDVLRPTPAADATLRGNPEAGYGEGYGGTRFPETPTRNIDVEVTAPAPTRQRASRPAPRRSEADELNEIVLRLHRGEPPTTETERRLADRMGIAYRKGGMVKPQAYKKGGLVKPKAAIIKSKAKSPAKLKGKTLMKKGGEASLASGLRGGVVKKPGTDSFNFQAKKMATGGVVEKGGNKYGFTNAKTKMLRRGGMAKKCK